MIYSATNLAQRRGWVVITAEWDRSSYPWKRTDRLAVQHQDPNGAVLEETTIERIPDEPARDTKARAIAAVRMLGYWPALRRQIAEDRRLGAMLAGGQVLGGYSAGKTSISRTVKRLLEAGFELPPGVE